MISTILGSIGSWIVWSISLMGYWGIVLLMAVQSANIPIPSEIIMPFAGYLVWQGSMNIWWVTLAGAVGTLVGSVFSYWLGMVGGRPLIEKYGKYILISNQDLDRADAWFKKYGQWSVFFGRFLPIVRTFISFPAGIARMDFGKFCLYSFLGSIPWTLALAWIGERLGASWNNLSPLFHRFDYIILILIILGLIWWIWRHFKNK